MQPTSVAISFPLVYNDRAIKEFNICNSAVQVQMVEMAVAHPRRNNHIFDRRRTSSLLIRSDEVRLRSNIWLFLLGWATAISTICTCTAELHMLNSLIARSL